jgi:hypothetical protein
MAICALASAPAASASIGRARADKLAIAILHPGRSSGPTVVFALPSPVSAGASVFEAKPATRIHSRRLAHPTWLFWEDQQYQALFTHPSVLLLIDAQTGRVVRQSRLDYFPLINGRRPAFLATSAAYRDPRNWVFSGHLPLVKARTRAARTASLGPVEIAPGELKHDCLVMIGDREEPILKGSFAAMLDWARQIRLPAYPDQATSVATLHSTVAVANGNGCDDVFLFIAGHGEPAVHGSAGVDLDSHAGPISVKQPDGTWTIDEHKLTPQDLKALVDANPQIDFKIKIESCYSGRFANVLTVDDPLNPGHRIPYAENLSVLELSSPADKPSYAQIKLFKIKLPGHKATGGVPVNDNPHGAGEFANGNFHGLQEWARSQTEINKTDGDLAQGIADAFTLGMPFNAAATFLAPPKRAVPLLFTRRFRFRARVTAHEASGGVSVTGHTHGRFDTVQVDAPAGDSITNFDVHGHHCDLIDDQGTVYKDVSGGITLPTGRHIVSIRCVRKPTDDDIDIFVMLGSGSGKGKTVQVTIDKGGQAVFSDLLAVHP